MSTAQPASTSVLFYYPRRHQLGSRPVYANAEDGDINIMRRMQIGSTMINSENPPHYSSRERLDWNFFGTLLCRSFSNVCNWSSLTPLLPPPSRASIFVAVGCLAIMSSIWFAWVIHVSVAYAGLDKPFRAQYGPVFVVEENDLQLTFVVLSFESRAAGKIHQSPSVTMSNIMCRILNPTRFGLIGGSCRHHHAAWVLRIATTLPWHLLCMHPKH